MILFIKHIDIEGPGTIETYVKEKGLGSQTVSLHKGEMLPESLDDVDAVVVLGGPMNVYEEDKFPFLKDEDAFIKKIVKEAGFRTGKDYTDALSRKIEEVVNASVEKVKMDGKKKTLGAEDL